MRKYFLQLMIIFALTASAWADSLATIGTPGIFRTYQTNNEVIISRENAVYSRISGYQVADDEDESTFWGAYITGGGNLVPSGTLFTEEMNIALSGEISGDVIKYLTYDQLDELGGKWARWSINTSPMTIGAMTFPENIYPATMPEIGSVVPYVKLVHEDGDANITRILVYFAEYGNNMPVNVSGVPEVRVTLEGTNINEQEFTRSAKYTDFTRTSPVVHDIAVANLDDTCDFYVYVEFSQGYDTYRWTFQHDSEYYDEDEYAITWEQDGTEIAEGEIIEINNDNEDSAKRIINITFPEKFSFNSISSGNENLLTLGYNLISGDDGEVARVRLRWQAQGYTTLRLMYEDLETGKLKSEMRVVKLMNYDAETEDWLDPEDWAEESPLVPYVKSYTYTIAANYVESRPFYDSALMDYWGNLGLSYNAELSDDAEGILAVDSNIYTLVVSSDGVVTSTSSFTEINGTCWVDFPDYEELSGIINISDDFLTFKSSADVMTSEFIPYFEFVKDGHNVESIHWYFIAPDTGEAISPSDIEQLQVWHDFMNDEGEILTASSGYLEGGFSDTDSVYVYFRYRINDEWYNWEFSPMSPAGRIITNTESLRNEPISVAVDDSVTINFGLGNSSVASITVYVGSEDIISVDGTGLDPEMSSQSITISGLKDGDTTISLVLRTENRGVSSYRVAGPYWVHSGEYTPPSASGGLELYVEQYSDARIIENITRYNDTYDNDTSVKLMLKGSVDIPDETYAYYRNEIFDGTVYYDAGNGNIYEDSLTLEYDENDNSVFCELNDYESGYIVSWDFPLLNISGGKTLSYTAKSSLAQYRTYKPYIELTRDGVNITAIKWNFVDGSNRTKSISGITDIELSSSIGTWNTSSGSATLDYPVPFDGLTLCVFRYVEDGVNYVWTFEVMSRNEYYNGDIYDDEWGLVSLDVPRLMKVGEIYPLSLDEFADLEAYSSNTSILTAKIEHNIIPNEDGDEEDDVWTLMLEAKASGVATFSVANDNNFSIYPVEIWVYDNNGYVSGISSTETAENIIARIQRGYSGEYEEDNESETPSEPRRYIEADDIYIENGDPITFTGTNSNLNSLSVRPRFGVPQDPSDGAYLSMWDYTVNLGLEDVQIFEDEDFTDVIDPATVFNEIKSMLINEDIPQLLAVVLPEIVPVESGYYTFSVSVDNIPNDTNIFWYSNYDTTPNTGARPLNFTSNDLDEDNEIATNQYVFMKSDGTLTDYTISSDNGNINVSAYLEAGETYAPIITAAANADDARLIDGNAEALAITTTSLTVGTTGTDYSVILSANYGAVTWSVSSGELPEGLSLNGITGKISGTPETAGTYSFTVKAASGTSSAEKTYTLMIGSPDEAIPLMIMTESLDRGKVGESYDVTLEANYDGVTWSLTLGELPEGLELDPDTGEISGTPTLDGEYTFTITATRSDESISQEYTITIDAEDTPDPLEITPALLEDGKVGESYDVTLTANYDGVTWSWTGNIPTGLTLSRDTGAITGTPTVAGEYTFTAIAALSGDTDSHDFTITIEAQATPEPTPESLAITTTALSGGKVGEEYSATLIASTTGVTWSASGLPTWLSLNASTGSISGTPTTSGTYTFTVTATKGTLSSSKSYTITIIDTLTIITETLSGGIVGRAYRVTLTVSIEGVTWSKISGDIPDGLALSSRGEIFGRPTTSGTYTFTVTATKGTLSDSHTYTITIINTPSTLRITTDSYTLPEGKVGEAYSATLTTNLEGTTWMLLDGILPLGLTLDENTGEISGIPTASGVFIFSVIALCSEQTADTTCIITINSRSAPEEELKITTDSFTLPEGKVGEAYSATLTTNLEGTTWMLLDGILPLGLTLDENTGEISGIPTASGVFIFSVIALCSEQTTDTMYTITINPRSAPEEELRITTDSYTLLEGKVGEAYSATLTTNLEGTTWMLLDGILPLGLTLDENTGEISGIPTASGVFIFSVIALYSEQTTDTMYIITINSRSAPEEELKITTETLSGGTVGTTYSETLTANYDGVTWSWTGNIPTGLTLSRDTGAITGTPTVAGEYTFTAIAALSGDTDSHDFTITIEAQTTPEPTPGSLAITTNSLPGGKVGEEYSATLTANYDGVTWSASGLPAWLSLNASTGVITGTPTTSGTYTFTITATKGTLSSSKSYTITIAANSVPAPDPETLEILTTSLADGTTGESYSYALRSSITGVTWSWAGNTPTGLTLSRDTGAITGTPTVAGTYTFTITALHSATVAHQSFTIIITAQNHPGTPDAESPDKPFDSRDITGNNDTPTPTPTYTPVLVQTVSIIPTASRITIEDASETVRDLLRNANIALYNTITSNTDVIALTRVATIGTTRTLEDAEAATLPRNQQPAIILPVISSVVQDSICMFSVSLANLNVNAPLYWHPMTEDAITGLRASDSGEDVALFIHDSGDVSPTVPSNKFVTIAAYFQKGKTYAPVITTSAPSTYAYIYSNGSTVYNPVTPESPDQPSSNNGGGSGGGGGCNTGISFIALALLGLFRKK